MVLSEFDKINWLPINDPFEQCISPMKFKYFSNLSPSNMNDAFKPAGQHTTNTSTSLLKLSQPLQKTSHGQKKHSYVARSIWNKSPDSLKTTETVNTYKHRVKNNLFLSMNNKENNMYNYL